MIRTAKPALIGLALLGMGAILSGCSSSSSFDPEDLFSWTDRKTKLPGERRPLFPEGIPGVSQGVPPELMKSNQPQATPDAATAAVVTPAEPEPEAAKPKPQAKPKAKPRVAVRPAPAAQAPAQQEQQPVQQQQQQQTGADAPWPSPSAQQQQPSSSPWPSAPASGTFQR